MKSTKANTGSTLLKRVFSILLTLVLISQFLPSGIFTALAATGAPIGAVSSFAEDSAFMGENPNTRAYLFTTVNGEKVRVVFYKNDLFRIWMADGGTGEFTETDASDLPESQKWDLGGITSAQDLEIVAKKDFGSMPSVSGTEAPAYYEFATPTLKLRAYKDPFCFEMLDADGNTVWKEAQPITRASGATTQVMATDEDEYFFGGGMQVGYFSHKGRSISISRSGWGVGTAPSPVPFYMSTSGFGVFRNTYKNGVYDFRSNSVTEETHNERRFDAFYFYGPSFEGILDGYTELTGRPAMIPRWGIGTGDAGAYRQISDTTAEGGNPKDSQGYSAPQEPYGGFWRENGTVGVVQDYKTWYLDRDMPANWFLPNDGYGCEYNKQTHPGGSLGAAAAGLMEHNIRTGLWVGQPQNYTSANYTYGYPSGASDAVKLEAFNKEITAQTVDWGVRLYKIDVGWSSQKGLKGDMGIFNQMLNNIEGRTNERGMIVTVYGWAGGQRYTTLWSGDQSGTDDYIQYHIPTITGAGMSGYPVSTSDAGAIFNDNPGVYVRDFQMKLLVPTNIAMSNWGNSTTYSSANPASGIRATSDKRPSSQYHFTAEEIEINRKYAKLKMQLVPYIYSYARQAYLKGSPIVRPMVYDFPDDPNTYDSRTQYQYMSGDWMLAAPVYDPRATVRNNIYLPEGRWVDYWSGTEYFGPTTISVDAPYDTLPMFVRGGGIIPMYQESLYDGQEYYNGKKVNDTLIVDLYPEGKTTFNLYEDDGYTVKFRTENAFANTLITSDAPAAGVTGPLTVTIGAAQGNGFAGQVSERKNFLKIHAKNSPAVVKLGDEELKFYGSAEALDSSTEGGWFYSADDRGGTLYVKTPSISIHEDVVIRVDRYLANKTPELENSLPLPENVRASTVSDSAIRISWEPVERATAYDLEIDGQRIVSYVSSGYEHTDLSPKSSHTYRIKARNTSETSGWTVPVTGYTAEDPNVFLVPKAGMTATFSRTNTSTGAVTSLGQYSTEAPGLCVDGSVDTQFHSADPGTGYYANLNINLNGLYMVDTFEYMPRPEKSNGCISQYRLFTSMDGTNYNQVASGSWSWTGESGQFTSRTITFAPTMARYIRLQAVASTGRFLSGREVWIYRTQKDIVLNSIAQAKSATGSSVWQNDGTLLDKISGLSAYTADGDSESGGGYMPPLAVDGKIADELMGWRTAIGRGFPISLNISWAGGAAPVCAFKYYPLPEGAQQREGRDGDVTGYALYAVTASGNVWLAGGTWQADGQPKLVNFRPVSNATGLQFVVTDAVGGRFGAAAEVEVYKKNAGGDTGADVYPEPSYAAGYAVDGRLDTGWSSADGQEGSLTVDLGEARTFDLARIIWGTREYGRTFSLESSENEADWTAISGASSSGSNANEVVYSFAPVTARYVRMVGTAATVGYTVRELQIYGPDKATGITLDKTTAALDVGDTLTLKATVAPATTRDQTVIWTSSNPDVVSIGRIDGEMKALAAGTAVITAESGEIPGLTATCSVTVSEVSVDSIVMNKDSLVLAMGETFQLEASIRPAKAANNAISWDSENPAIVRVSHNGFVTAVLKGETAVTATAQSKSGATAVTVTDLKSVSLDNSAGKMVVTFDAIPDRVLAILFSATCNDGKGVKPMDIYNMTVDRESNSVTFDYIPFLPNSQQRVDVSVRYKHSTVVGTEVPVAQAYTVTFDNQGADILSDPTFIVVSSPATTVGQLPVAPVRNGFSFAGWFTQPGGLGEPFLADTPVTGDTTVYAKWVGVPRTVTFVSNGGSAVEPVTVENGALLAKPADPTRAYFLFVGWYKDAALTTPWNFASDVVMSDITLYAKWILAGTVTFESNGGSYVAPYVNIPTGTTIPEPATPTRDGFTFVGWYRNQAFTSKWNFATDILMSSITLYARWVETGTSTVTFNSLGGNSLQPMIVANGQMLTKLPTPARANYVFNGWYKDESCTQAWQLLSDVVVADITLYAGWIAPLFTYGFESAGELEITGQPYAVVAKSATAEFSAGTGLKGGGSLHSAANNSYIRVDANNFLYRSGVMTMPFTVSMWIKPAAVNRQQYLFTCSSGDDWLLLRDGGYLGSYYFGSGNDTYSHTPIRANEWTLVTATVSSSNVTYYLNGAQVAQTSAASWLGNNAGFFAFGGKSNSTSSTGCFTGYMDQIHFFNRTLTADQVKALYLQEVPPVIAVTSNPAATTGLYEGESATLFVSASATPDVELSYQWYSASGIADFNGQAIEGAVDSSFAVPSTLTAGNYYYYCVISAEGAVPVKSTMATVSVAAQDFIVKVDPRAKILVAGCAANITVEVTAKNPVAGDVYAAIYDQDGVELYSVKIVDGKGTIRADMIPNSENDRTFTVRAYAEGAAPSSNIEEISVVSPVDLWTPKTVLTQEGFVSAIRFGGKISFKDTGSVKLTVGANTQTLAKSSYSVANDSIVFKSPLANEGKLVIAGLKYYELFPSYSFTFTVTMP